jgi:hypothetical protein
MSTFVLEVKVVIVCTSVLEVKIVDIKLVQIVEVNIVDIVSIFQVLACCRLVC